MVDDIDWIADRPLDNAEIVPIPCRHCGVVHYGRFDFPIRCFCGNKILSEVRPRERGDYSRE